MESHPYRYDTGLANHYSEAILIEKIQLVSYFWHLIRFKQLRKFVMSTILTRFQLWENTVMEDIKFAIW